MSSARPFRALMGQPHLRLSRSISTTPRLDGLMDKIKGVFTGKPTPSAEPSFNLIEFASQMDKAGMMGKFKDFEVGRCSSATITDAFKKSSEILRYLGTIDPSGQNLQISHKQAAAKHCNCTIAEVEHILAKYTWAKEAQTKLDKLKEEGKPMPTSFKEVQKMMGSTPLDVGRSNMAKTGQVSRNALCPCGSKKRYKRLIFGVELATLVACGDRFRSPILRSYSPKNYSCTSAEAWMLLRLALFGLEFHYVRVMLVSFVLGCKLVKLELATFKLEILCCRCCGETAVEKKQR